jgi:hypothetical protein
MGTARFYEFLASENPELNVFVLQPGIIRTALYDKGKLELDATIDTSRPQIISEARFRMLTIPQLSFPPISQCGWQAPRPSLSLDASCLQIGMLNN